MIGVRVLALVLLLPLNSCLIRSEITKASGGGKPLVPDSEVIYKRVGDVHLKMHVFKPEGWKASDRRPAIVFFFGGAWSGGTPSQFYPHCKYLASRGMVAMAADYRVKTRHQTTPKECVKDGKSAVRWVRQHARSLGVDPEKVVAGGGSAGGHVAAATGTVKGFEEHGASFTMSSRPDALILFSPVIDNSPTGFGFEQVGDYWEEFSPMHNIDQRSPPTIFFLGTRDKLIPVTTAEEYQRRMNEEGRRCDLHLYRGENHGFFNAKKRRGYERTVREMDAFLVSLGFLDEE